MSQSRFHHHTPQYEASIGNFSLSYHLEMIKDQERVGRIKAALDESLQPDGIHCELGIGTGLFAIYAASKCKRVYAVERDPSIFSFAKANIERSPYAHKIELILSDAMNFKPQEKVDSLLVEMMSIWGINEPQVAIMNHAQEHILKSKGQAMPRQIINLVELGHYDFQVMDVHCETSIPQFTGVVAPRIMSCSAVFNRFDFIGLNQEAIKDTIMVESLLSGTINCARLSSLVQLSEHITFYSTDSLMPQTIIPLNELEVKSGDQIQFSADFQVKSSLDESRFSISH